MSEKREIIIEPTRRYCRTIPWGIWEAVREFLQNAIDEMTELKKTNGRYVVERLPIRFDVESDRVVIEDYGKGLSVEAVQLLGYSIKKPLSIGRFGEGLKVASGVLLDKGCSVKIESVHGTLIPKFVKVDGEEVLRFDYYPELKIPTGTRVTIEKPGIKREIPPYALPCGNIILKVKYTIDVEIGGYVEMVHVENEIRDFTTVDGKGCIWYRGLLMQTKPALLSYNIWSEIPSEAYGLSLIHI